MASRPVPPPQPAVIPQIPWQFPTDQDGDRIQDSLAVRARQAGETATGSTDPVVQARAWRELEETVGVELIFDRQIDQTQLDAFLGNGGQVIHVYEAVSYGWNGRLPLGKILALPRLMGDSLVQVEEERAAVLHLDQATRTGRVRPVWASGYAGNPAGFDGDSNITISILDTGVDGTHSDLIGRNVFWHDYTSDAEPSPIDLIQHGTHVSGIALGTGAAAGSATGDLLFSDEGDLFGVPNGSFYPTPFGLAAVSTTVTIVATWQGGGAPRSIWRITPRATPAAIPRKPTSAVPPRSPLPRPLRH